METGKPYDKDFAKMVEWLKSNRLEAHTDIKGHTVFVPSRKSPPL